MPKSRLHLRPLVCCLALLAALGVLFLAPSAGAFRGSPIGPQPTPRPQLTYLALGDSLAFGYSLSRFESLLPEENPAGFDTGYVDDVSHVLEHLDPDLQVVNDGCPGETTESFITGPCQYQLSYPLHHPYTAGKTGSQLADALTYLKEHPGAVNPITIDIGANDALGLVQNCKLEAECIMKDAPGLLERISTNLGLILTELRSAAPRALIVVLGLYNPYGSTITGGNQLTESLNETMAKAAAAIGARFADPLPFFNPPGAREAPTICLLTNMCPTPPATPDIHPTELGYKVLAKVILRQLGLPFFFRHGFFFGGHGHRGHGALGHGSQGAFGLRAHRD